MCGSVTLSRRIKQGDSISSQLYIMSIDPLLMRVRNEPLFQRITIPWDGTIQLTAYADGIPFEPLWYNSYVTHNINIITVTVIQ